MFDFVLDYMVYLTFRAASSVRNGGELTLLDKNCTPKKTANNIGILPYVSLGT